MPELYLFFFVVLLVFTFAAYGFIRFLMFLIRVGGSNDRPTYQVEKKRARSLGDDVLGASLVLDYLRGKNRIDQKTYDRLRGFLEDEFGDEHDLSRSLVRPPDELATPPEPAITVIDDRGHVHELPPKEFETKVGKSPDTAMPGNEPGPVPVALVSTAAAVPLVPNELVSTQADESVVAGELVEPAPPVAPWDIPDPPAPEPKRTFGEVMAGFMLEKNIRWGELASGILIVGSAVGLVVSLRNELRDTIPYFSALLFMLITAAIHAAGIYTLKKWKLQNTSRGTLLIGLLLIPLNFVAACILSGSEADRREFSDPLLWIALVIGLSSFTAMTWFSSKCLFRRGQLPMVIAIIGGAVGTLVINRVADLDSSSLPKMLLTLPLVASFLVGTAAFYKRQWVRVRWPERSANRLFIFLGLSTFALLTAVSLLITRAEDRSAAVVAIMPALSIVALLTAWLGRIIWRGAGGKEAQRLSLTGLTLHILGLSLLAASVFVSASNPTVLLINTAIISLGLILFAKHQAEPRLLPAAWVAFAAFVLCAVNLVIGKLSWDTWASARELFDAAISGHSGLSLLAAGTGVAGLHFLYGHRAKDQSRFMRVGLFSGAAIFLVGCTLALVASFVNRDNTFDMMTATSLLGLASLLALVACLKVASPPAANGSDNIEVIQYLSHAAALLLLGFLAHAFLWNRAVQDWLNQLVFGINANWVIVFAVHSIVIATVALFSRFRLGSAESSSFSSRSQIPGRLGEWSSVTNVIGLLGSFLFIPYQSGFATTTAIVLCVGWLLLVWVQPNHRLRSRFWISCFEGATGFTVAIFVSELVTKTDWCPPSHSPRFWLVLFIGLSIWAAVWIVGCWLLPTGGRLKKLVDFHPRVEWGVIHSLVLAVGWMAGVALIGETAREISPDAGDPFLSLTGDKLWVFGLLFGVGSTLLLAVFQWPLGITGAALIVTWFLAWGFGAEYFADSRSAGTAIRWLLSIGGAVGAVLVASRKPLRPVWVAARNRMGFKGKSTWGAATTQILINFELLIVSILVLSISTATIVQYLMHGSVGGPLSGSWFGDLQKDVSYGVPIGIVVGTFLLYAISEKRKWLAMAGSAVFQYCVVLAVILLFASPHEKLASSWFVNVLQAVSVGMTAYGFVWFYYRDRISGRVVPSVTGRADPSVLRISQIEIHTLINGLLITSLAILVIIRFYVFPDRAGDWINSVGGLLGIVAWAVFGGLIFTVWQKQLSQPHRTSTWMWLTCWLGLVLVAMVAAFVDRRYADGGNTIPWLTFKVIIWGAALVCLSQVVFLWLERRPQWAPGLISEPSSQRFTSIRSDQTLPLVSSGFLLLSCGLRGAWLDSGSFWGYLAAIGLLIGCLVFAGLLRRSTWLSFISLVVTALAASLWVAVDPAGQFTAGQPYHVNVLAIAFVLLALVWSGFYVHRSLAKQEKIRRSFVWMPNLVLLCSSIWVLLGSLAQWVIEIEGPSGVSSLANTLGVGAMVSPVLLFILHLWNDNRKFQVISCGLWMTGMTIFCLAISIPEDGMRNASIVFGMGAVITVWGLVWVNREAGFSVARTMNIPALIRLERSMNRQLPVMGLILGGIVLVWSFMAMLRVEPRPERYLTAMSPFAVAFGLGCMSDAYRRRWLQLMTLALLTVGAILFAWADLSPSDIGRQPIRLFVRALLVLAGAMFVYGGLVARWVRGNDSWLKSLREMAVATCALALLCFGLVMWQEIVQFQADVGCGMPVTEAIAVSVVVIGMIAGLILIAVRPKDDPFSLSLQGRMGYVYAAQAVTTMLMLHLYLTMPWLFQFGIKDYWPYIAMLVCFGGVGVARLLEKRDLAVLAQPLFNTAAILPIIVAACIWGIDSKTDPSLVILTVGMAYLMISFTHKSILSGGAAILFGNLALWLFYDKFEGFSFVEHPQFWLIPPALSALVAAQISRNSLTREQTGMIRYICVTAIYLSSTSEVFINGLGQQLWPPIILAVLAIGGILAGMLMQVRAFLYLGSVFLLLAMITMVSHAHQRLDHVWPWWAFGIGMGVSILVMFGLFEKRKNDLKQISARLREWDL